MYTLKCTLQTEMPKMETTAKSLRGRVGEILACVDRGQSVIITYRGKPRAKLIGMDDPGETASDGGDYPGFGMWEDHEEMRDVGAWLRGIRQARNAG